MLLISMDTTRADRLGSYGSALGATPRIDAIAGEGVVFENAVSPSPRCCSGRVTLAIAPAARVARQIGQIDGLG